MSVVDSLKFLLPSLHRMVVSCPLDVMLNLLLFPDTQRPGCAQAHTHLHNLIKFLQLTINLAIILTRPPLKHFCSPEVDLKKRPVSVPEIIDLASSLSSIAGTAIYYMDSIKIVDVQSRLTID